MGSFIPCIQMDAYPYEHSPKRKVVPAPYFQLLQVAVILYVDGASIFSGGTFSCMGAGIYAAAFQRAAVFVRIFYGIITPWTHFMPGRAEGMSGFVKSDVCLGIFR